MDKSLAGRLLGSLTLMATMCLLGADRAAAVSTPSITSNASPNTTVGMVVFDVAHLSGGANPTGTVTFNLFGPDDATCVGQPALTSTISVTGNGSYTSANLVTSQAGTYHWQVSYSGDANNNRVPPTACSDPAEQVVVTGSLATPIISTTASGPVAVGGTASDTASLQFGTNPTGTITFRLFGPGDAACANVPVFSSMRAVTGNGNYTSGTFAAQAVGTYQWTASYSGDANNAAVVSACGAANESVTVTKANATIVTVASGPVLVGGTISDTATLSGGFSPTGTITFALFGPNNATCAGVALFTSTTAVIGTGNYSSAPFTTTAPGTYRWVTTYSGDANTNPAGPTACTDPAEAVAVTTATTTTTTTTVSPTTSTSTTTTPSTTTTSTSTTTNTSTTVPAATTTSTTVVKAKPTIVTTASASVPVAVAVSDTATLAGGAAPSGTIMFALFAPTDPTCAASPVFTSITGVTGNGPYSSGSFTAAATGTYRWTAEYSGDAANNPVLSACGSANEAVTVTKANTTLVTQASAPVTLGGAISDTATLSGGFSPTGTISFQVFGPNDTACAATPAATATVTVSGTGNYPSGPFIPTIAGTYRWVATYSGDVNSNPVGPTSCADRAETVVVSAATTTSTSTTSTSTTTTSTTTTSTTTTSTTTTSTTTTSSSTTTTSSSTTSTSTTTTLPLTTTSTSTTTTSSTTTPPTTTTTVPSSTTTSTTRTSTTPATTTMTTSTTGAPTTSSSTTTPTSTTSTTVGPTTTTTTTGPTVRANPSVLAAGQSTMVSGSGFPGGSALVVTLFSTPVQLGTTTADGAGHYQVTVVIPAFTAPGSHTLAVATNSGAVQAQTTITVTAATTATSPATAAGGGLSLTGADIRGPGFFGVMLMSAGVIVIGATWRRRRFD